MLNPTSKKSLIRLSLPIILMIGSGHFMGFCDRIFLARISLEQLEGCTQASFLSHFFQNPLILLASITQVFVGQCLGAKLDQKAGKLTWQMIWISLFSIVFTIPLGFIIAPFYFNQTQSAGMHYFYILLSFNFAYPIGSTLSSFYIGQGKGDLPFFATMIANSFNLILNFLLIFGMPPFIPSMEILGAALATGMSQLLFCMILFICFLRKKEKKLFGTWNFHLNFRMIGQELKLGIPRSLSRSIILFIWTINAYIMSTKGPDYLLILSTGSTLFLSFFFISEGLSQAVITAASYLIGKEEKAAIKKLIKSSISLIFFASCLFAFPCIFFPLKTVSFLLHISPTLEQKKLIIPTCFWIWLFFITQGINHLANNLLVASGDTLFLLMYNASFRWMLALFLFLIMVEMFQWPPYCFYVTLTLTSTVSACVYFLRFKLKRSHLIVSQHVVP